MRHAIRATALALPAYLGARASWVNASGDVSPPSPALSASEFRSFKISSITNLTPDTKRYTLALPSESDTSGVTTASCLVVKAKVGDKDVVRPYTPVSPASQRGSLDLIVKTYPNGSVSKALWELKAGDSMEVKGPYQKFAYTANQWSSVGLVAGGTGITPMYQLIVEMLSNPRDRTEIRLVYGCRSEQDIILRDELDALAAAYPNFKVLYTLSKPSAAWQGAVGHITKATLASFLPPPQEQDKTKVLVSGPPAFMAALCGDKKSPSDQGPLVGALSELKYAPSQVFKY